MKLVKTAVRTLLRRAGLDIVRYAERLDDLNRPLDLLDLAIRWRLQLFPQHKFFFIQIGANDGVRHDPLRATILDCHLTGLLVEPLPDMFEELKRNYKSETQLKYENAAITGTDGEVSIFRLSPDAPVEDDVKGIATFNRRWIEEIALGMKLSDRVQEVRVPAITFKSLIDKHAVSGVDLLQVDTEGFDWEVVKMAFQAGIFPEIINFEYVHLSLEDRCESRRVLAVNGYRFVDGFRDTLAIRKSWSG